MGKSVTVKPAGAEPKKGFQPGNMIGAHGRGAEARRRGRFLTQNLISQLQEVIQMPEAKTHEEKKKYAETVYWINKRLIRNALDGDNTAIKLIMDRVEGTPLQSVHLVDNTPEAAAAKLNTTVEQLATMTPDEQARIYQAAILATKRPDSAT